MDAYDPATVFSSIDEGGRYAFGNQPRIALWNLTRLAECLLPLFDETEEKAIAAAQDALGGFAARFDAAFHEGMRAKLGLVAPQDGDSALFGTLLTVMGQQQCRLYAHIPGAVRRRRCRRKRPPRAVCRSLGN